MNFVKNRLTITTLFTIALLAACDSDNSTISLGHYEPEVRPFGPIFSLTRDHGQQEKQTAKIKVLGDNVVLTDDSESKHQSFVWRSGVIESCQKGVLSGVALKPTDGTFPLVRVQNVMENSVISNDLTFNNNANHAIRGETKNEHVEDKGDYIVFDYEFSCADNSKLAITIIPSVSVSLNAYNAVGKGSVEFKKLEISIIN